MAEESIITDDTTTETQQTETQTQTEQTEQTTETSTETQEVDWRTRLSGGDEKLLGYLGRYQSEKAFVEAAKKDRDQARNARKPLPENPTDDELAAYRKDMGIPEAPEGYMESLPDGLVVGDDDKPYVDQFLAAMHQTNAPKEIAGAALQTYYKIIEEQAAQEAEAVNEAKNEAIEVLREEWGAEYKRNLNIMNNHISALPEEIQEVFKYGKGADGRPIGYNPNVLKWLTSLALEANPVATVVPGAGANQASAIATEMADLEKMMGDRNSAYWKGSNASNLQARYVQLVEAKQKLG